MKVQERAALRALILLVMFSTTGCLGGEKSFKESVPENRAPSWSIVGSWKGECIPVGKADSELRYYTFMPDGFYKVTSLYWQTNVSCNGEPTYVSTFAPDGYKEGNYIHKDDLRELDLADCGSVRRTSYKMVGSALILDKKTTFRPINSSQIPKSKTQMVATEMLFCLTTKPIHF